MKTIIRHRSGDRVLRWALMAAVLVLAPCAAHASVRDDVLAAIHSIENPKDSTRVGRHGELGAFQFRPSTWRMYTDVPFAQALDRSASDEVAIRHYEWLKRGLLRSGLSETPYNIGLAWNGGLTAAIRGHASAAARDYAQRVSNLVQENRLAAARLALDH